MPYPLSPDAEAALAAGRMVSALLVDLYCFDSENAPATLRCWDWPEILTYPAADAADGNTPVDYESMHRRMQVDRDIKFSAGIGGDAVRISFDGSRIGDDQDFIGRMVDRDWHQRIIRVRQVLLNLDAGTSPTEPVWTWRGRIDAANLSRTMGQPDQWQLTCEGGLFRIRGRRMHTRTDADQRRRNDSDAFFAGVPQMISAPIIWAKKPTGIGSGNAPYSPNWDSKQNDLVN